MSLPDWESFSGGTMKRAALWLATCVGEGEVFTKDDLRVAFPGISQIDRRVRDLRQHGWIIDTRSQDIELELEEQRLVRIGGRVWERDYKSPVRGASATPKQRQLALESSNYRCAWCGVAAGEPFPDDILTIATLAVTGSDRDGWIAVCQQCKGGGAEPASLIEFDRAYAALELAERSLFAKWAHRGARAYLPIDNAWDKFRRLSSSNRSEVLGRVQED